MGKNIALLEAHVIAALESDSPRSGIYSLEAHDIRKFLVEHKIRDAWVAYIAPAWHPPAILAVIKDKVETKGIFTFGGEKIKTFRRQLEYTSTSRVTFNPNWLDPVEPLLQQADFPLEPAQSVKDGIDYKLYFYGAKQLAVDFSNAGSKPHAELEKAIFGVAKEIVKLTGGRTERKYLSNWQKYFHRH